MSPRMTVLGLDVSLRSTGWAVLTYEDGALVDCGVITTTARNTLAARLRQIHRAVQHLGDHADVGIEEGVAHRSGTTTRILAAAWGAAVLGTRVDPHTVNVSTLKRLATGKGNATKAEMIAAAVDRWGPTVHHPDIADACWIAEATRLHLVEETERAIAT